MSRTRLVLAGTAIIATTLGTVAVVGCKAADHPVAAAGIGTARSAADLEAVLDEPGPIEVKTVVAADWQVPLSGLLNLDHPKAEAAGLEDRPEPIKVYLHSLRHPTKGSFIIDTGVERALEGDPDNAAIRGLVASVMDTDAMTVHVDTATWLAQQPEPLAGVLLTHLHLDHVSGMPDVPRGTPIYAGPGETEVRAFEHLFVASNIERTLEGHGPIREWQFQPDPSGRFAGVLDVFGDGSRWALHVPGHTPDSTAYLARTPDGPVLFTGDVCHTRWGWENGVEPCSFTHDHEANADSLARLKKLVADYPNIDVRLGHQELSAARASC